MKLFFLVEERSWLLLNMNGHILIDKANMKFIYAADAAMFIFRQTDIHVSALL